MSREVRDMPWPRFRRHDPVHFDEDPNRPEVSILLIEPDEMQ